MKLSELSGHWALVTGASSGIGKEFARQLATKGMHLVLVARRKPLLDELASELESRTRARALPLALDLTRGDDVGNTLKNLLHERSITPRLICNNAGFGRWDRFEKVPLGDYVALLRLNVMAPLSICHHFFEDLSKFPSSVVINVSSQAAIMPIPFMATYGASKAALHSMSLALGEEWASRGILVQTLVPGPTRTGFDSGKPGVTPAFVKRWDAVEKVVAASLAAIETGQGLVVTARGFLGQKLFWAATPYGTALRVIASGLRPPE